MGQQTIELFAGGGIPFLAPSSNTTIRWWLDRRVQVIRASLAGLTMTIDPATSTTTLPWGSPALVIVNPKDATNSFTLAATGWTLSVGVGKAVIVSRVKNNGSPQWWPMLFNIL